MNDGQGSVVDPRRAGLRDASEITSVQISWRSRQANEDEIETALTHGREKSPSTGLGRTL